MKLCTHWSISFSCFIDLLLSNPGVFDSLIDFCSEYIGCLECDNQWLIHSVSEVSSLFCSDLRISSSIFKNAFFSSTFLLTISVFFLFELMIFQLNNLREHLIFHAFSGNGEVDNANLHECFGRIAWIWVCWGHEEFKVRTDRNSLFSKGEFQPTVCLDELLKKNRLKRWI